MRRYLASLAASACVLAFSSSALADNFTNGSFETGDLTGWTQGGGTWFGGSYPTPSEYLPGGVNNTGPGSSTITSAGFDPLTDNKLRTVYAGAHSAQVNNSTPDYSVSVISQKVTNYTDPLIAFAYAAVLQTSHGLTDSDAFIISLSDDTTKEVLFTYNLNSAAAPGSFTLASTGWYYTDWVEQSIDVSGRLGHDFTLSLLANDCPYGAHAGYAYLDGFGSVVGGGGTGGGGDGTETNFWDGDATGNSANGTIDGGNGVWSATSLNFTDAAGTAAGTQAKDVTFAGTPGTVTVDASAGAIAVDSMLFGVDGYHITGDSIALTGTAPTITVGDGTPAGAAFTATIDSVLTGTNGLTKAGAGTLVLNGVNTYGGGTTVAAGTLVGSATSFGTGAVANAAAFVIDQPTDAAFTNAITGAGTFEKRGAGVLVLGPVNTYTGVTTVTGGTLAGTAASFGTGAVVDNATFLITQAADATFANTISGTGTFIKAGTGTLQLTGTSTLTGGTEVVGGALRVDGSLANSTVTVGKGTVLTGTGTVGGVKALRGSTVAPGNGLGTLDATGDYVQSGGSTYQVQLTSTGSTDSITAGGAANLKSGAGLNVTKTDSARYDLGRRYTVLTANGGLTGGYVLTGDTQVSIFYDLVASYDPTHVYLDVAQTHSFESVGLTPNQRSAARGADSRDGGDLYTAIAYLQDPVEARHTFDKISGEVHASLRGAAFEDSRFIREAVTNRLVGVDDGNRMWSHVFGSWGHVKGNGNYALAKRDIGGFFQGVDLIRGDDFVIGAVVGYSNSDLKVRGRESSAKTDDYTGGAYAGIRRGPIGVRVGAAYTVRNVSTERHVGLTGFSDTMKGKYDIGVGQVFGEAGYKLAFGKAAIEPFVGAAYVSVDTDTFRETGGDAKLFVPSKTSHVTFLSLGGRSELNVGPLKLTGMAAWRRASGDLQSRSTMRFAGGGNSFGIDGIPVEKNSVSLAGGGEFAIAKGATIGVSYSGQIGSDVKDHGAKANLLWRF